MIQRIQSLYLLLSGAGLLGLFALPFAKSDIIKESIFADGIYNLEDHSALMILCSCAAALALICIFLYSRRDLQLKVLGLTIVVILALLCFVAYIYFSGPSSGESQLALGSALPFLSIIFSVLAIRGIKKDNAIVKSMDRLR